MDDRDPTHDRALARERARLDLGPAHPAAWRRLCPHPLWDEAPLLGALESVLDAPEQRRALEACEAEERYPDEVLAALRARGLARLFAEGEGEAETSLLTPYHQAALNTITARRDTSLAITVGVNALALLPAYVAADPGLLARIFTRVRSGAACAMLLTENEHGSNLLRNEARAEPGALDAAGAFRALDEGAAPTHYRLTGEKHLINGGQRHDLLFALVRTAPPAPDAGVFERMAGFSVVCVERSDGAVGLPRWRTQPGRAADISGVRFPGLVVPADRLVGPAGGGFGVIKQTLTISRGGISALASGTLSRARDLARAYARRRDVYGAPIQELGAIAGHLLRLEALDRAVAALSIKAVAAINAAGTGAAYATCLAKVTCCALAEEGVAEGRRVLGGRALLRDLPYERLTRDVLLYGVFDGTSHVMLDELSKTLGDEARRHAEGRPSRVADPLAELRRLYAAPPARMLEVLRRRRPRPLVPPLPDHLRALAAAGPPAAAPLAEVAEALHALVAALQASGAWAAEQEVRFGAAEALGWLEAATALVELGLPRGRAALGLPALAAPPDPAERALEEAATPWAIAWLGGRTLDRVAALAAELSAPPARLAPAQLGELNRALREGQGERRHAFAAALRDSGIR